MSDDSEIDKPPFAVGYGRPPKETRYRKGQSGNPSGRPKAMKSFEELIYEKLNRKVEALENGKRKRVPLRALAASDVVKAAFKGDRHARKVMLDSDARAQARRETGIKTTARDLEADRRVYEAIMARLGDLPEEDET